MAKTLKLARAKSKLEAKLRGGWERAVFATPQEPDGSRDERVVEGPLEFAALYAAAQLAAQDGFVKQTYVLDARRRVELDARHGHLKLRELDDATLAKVMGGKDRSLRPDTSAALLRAIGIMNADGTISARNAKKYKQVNHLVELCRPVWAEREPDAGPLQILDLACGNSYLSFVVLEALRLEELDARLLGVDARADVITTSRERAAQIGFGDRSQFEVASLEDLDVASLHAKLGGPPQLAVSLHACDTATDAALALAIRAGVEWILAVPCCQAELARQLEGASGALAELTPAVLTHGLLRRTLASVLTDGLRVELLEACGYEVSVVEFVASSHTPKNLLLRARRRRRVKPKDWALGPIEARCAALGVEPALLRALREP